MKNYIEHLKAQVKYWQMISAAEREKNIKLEKNHKRNRKENIWVRRRK